MPITTLDLSGQWEFKQYPLSARRMRDLDTDNWLQTNVPSSVYTSLIQAGQIEKNDIDANPEIFQSISDLPWVFRKSFDVPGELLESDRQDMVFDGLDTIASIWLNNKLIGRTNNMFITFRFNVTKYLKPKNNSLLIKFESPNKYAKNLMNRYPTLTKLHLSNPHRVYIRKAQYQFGWDWAPSLPGCGIWKPVRIEAVKKARIENIHFRTVDCSENYADIKIGVKLDTVAKEDFICKLNLACDNQLITQQMIITHGHDFHSTLIRIEDPKLWWPLGYGLQNLYTLNVTLLTNKNEIIDSSEDKFGIRTIKLNRSKDEHGHKFQFEVNGQPVYAKGANWIPASIFAGSVTKAEYQQLLYDAKDANINMLRVWGGGYYETKDFYQLCDELGIMVWQDFMFACAYYPDRHWFFDQVKTEAAEIIKQLRNHPSLALWCGNNEVEWLHLKGFLGKTKKFYGKDIYQKLLPHLLSELDPDHNYIRTSPTGTPKNPNDPNTGTVHQWQIWHEHAPIRQYQCLPQQVPRFVTEFGIQSLPDFETIKNICPPEQRFIASQSVEKHNYQYDGNGNSRIFGYVGDLFGSAKNLENLVYLSQITQARAVKTYVEHLRAHNFRNSGALFWQFNDCCPAISWSAIDYEKKPKALYYYAKRFFSNQLIVVVPEFDQSMHYLPTKIKSINAVIINDTTQPFTATLNYRLMDLFGNLLDQVSLPIAVAPFSISAPLKLPKAICSPSEPQNCCLHLVMNKDKEKIIEKLFFYLPDKYICWPDVKISKTLSKLTEKQYKLSLISNAVAKDVIVTTNLPAKLSDNFFDLIANDEVDIIINYEPEITSTEPQIKLCSINDIFKEH